jgi:hypothetical protein
MHSNPIRTGVLTVLYGCGGLTESGPAVVGDPAWNNGGYLRLRFSLLDLEQLPLRTRLDPGTASGLDEESAASLIEMLDQQQEEAAGN